MTDRTAWIWTADPARRIADSIIPSSISVLIGGGSIGWDCWGSGAAAGVRPDLIDRWMGHQTQEMRERYRHFFPQEETESIARLDV